MKLPVLFTLLAGSFACSQTMIRVDVSAPSNLGLAPAIAGFSDGSFSIFQTGTAASAALEDLAETGSPAMFAPPEGGPIFGNNPSPPIFTPGDANSATFSVSDGNNVFSLASMLLPSNDWFLGTNSVNISALLNAAPGTSISIPLTTVYDAGTEEEDFAFSPGNGIVGVSTAGGGAADFGTDQNGLISVVSSPDPFGSFANASAGFDSSPFDFNASNGALATVTLTTVPEPSTNCMALFGVAFLLIGRRAHRRR